MKNPQQFSSVYIARKGDIVKLLTVSFSKNPNGSVWRVWNGYGDDCLATAGGYGYDKESAALDSAIHHIFGVDCNAHGAGVPSLIKNAAKKGVKIIDAVAESLSRAHKA